MSLFMSQRSGYVGVSGSTIATSASTAPETEKEGPKM